MYLGVRALLMCVPSSSCTQVIPLCLRQPLKFEQQNEGEEGEKGGFMAGLVFTSSPLTLFSRYLPLLLHDPDSSMSSVPSNT